MINKKNLSLHLFFFCIFIHQDGPYNMKLSENMELILEDEKMPQFYSEAQSAVVFFLK